ncbi:hypothetical protein [Streptomyces sp. NPDC002851]
MSRQVREMMTVMAQGAPVEVSLWAATMGKLARLAHLAEQFGYQYVDVQYASGNTLKLLLAPDPSPQAQQLAQQSWAQYPQAGAGGQLPPLPGQAPELMKTRITYDLYGRHNEKRRLMAVPLLTVLVLFWILRDGEDSWMFWVPVWVLMMAIAGGGILWTRKKHAACEAQLRAAGFVPMQDPTGRVHYAPPGGQFMGQAPQQQGYGVPPQQQGYGVPPQQQGYGGVPPQGQQPQQAPQVQQPHQPQQAQPQQPQQPYGVPPQQQPQQPGPGYGQGQQPYGQPPQQY